MPIVYSVGTLCRQTTKIIFRTTYICTALPTNNSNYCQKSSILRTLFAILNNNQHMKQSIYLSTSICTSFILLAGRAYLFENIGYKLRVAFLVTVTQSNCLIFSFPVFSLCFLPSLCSLCSLYFYLIYN